METTILTAEEAADGEAFSFGDADGDFDEASLFDDAEDIEDIDVNDFGDLDAFADFNESDGGEDFDGEDLFGELSPEEEAALKELLGLEGAT